MRVTLEKVERSHLETIRDWRNSDLIKNVSINRDDISMEQQLKWFEKIQASDSQLHWIIRIDGIDAGYAAIKDIGPNNDHCEFASLYIGDATFLHAGAGALAEFVIIDHIYCNYPKVTTISCEVLSSNKKVLQLHKKFGFVIEEQSKQLCLSGKDCDTLVKLVLLKKRWLDVKIRLEKLIKY